MTLHFPPAYSSWLNRVEICFSKLELGDRKGVLRSVNDLRKQLIGSIRYYNKVAMPIS